jgi:hypothetical protein
VPIFSVLRSSDVFSSLHLSGGEWKGARALMIPKELFAEQRIVGAAFLIAFVAGVYYYSLINFSPKCL